MTTAAASHQPQALLSADFAERAGRIRLIVMDVDGVLTDGLIIVDDQGQEQKNFNVRDGSALVGWMRTGGKTAILSGRYARCVEHRARDLGIQHVLQGNPRKLAGLARILQEAGVTLEETCFVGDDLPDLPLFGRVGLAAAPADAVDEVLAKAHFVSSHTGGRGVLNQLVKAIMQVQQTWQGHIDWYFERES
jgi:3-deoxy-D-manno-octulosonate 8-phosphate phosphatase (KDO 8-P phosphatase)